MTYSYIHLALRLGSLGISSTTEPVSTKGRPSSQTVDGLRQAISELRPALFMTKDVYQVVEGKKNHTSFVVQKKLLIELFKVQGYTNKNTQMAPPAA